MSIGAYAAVADDLKKRLRARAYHVPNAWDPEVAPRELPRASKVPRDTLTLVYTGTLSGVRALDPRPLLDALQTVRTEPGGSKIRLVIAGRLSRDERVLLGRSGLGSAVEHLGMLERAHALGLQRSADALVLLTARNASAATAKVFEYLAAGKPIIALAENNEAAEIVRDTNSGVLVAPDDVDAIATALRLAASGELAKHFAPRNLDRYTYPTPALAVEQLVEEAVDRMPDGT